MEERYTEGEKMLLTIAGSATAILWVIAALLMIFGRVYL